MTTLTTYYGNHDMRNKEGNLGNYNSKKEGDLFTTHQNLNFNTTSSLLNPGVKWFFLGQKCGVTFILGGKNESRTGEKIMILCERNRTVSPYNRSLLESVTLRRPLPCIVT